MLASLVGRLAQVALIGPAVARFRRKTVRTLIGGVLIAFFGVFGLAYLLIGLRQELDWYLGPIFAPLAIGAVLFVFAGIVYLALLRPRRSDAETAARQAAAMRHKIARPARKIEEQVAGNPLQSVAAAAAVGFAAAYLLRFLRQRSKAGEGEAGGRRHDDDDENTPPPWAREVLREVLREARRRRANGSGA